ncbi:phosphoadenosine phosphosulfate reductase family protein [Rhizobium sp. NPDC090275]|uniref:phosphoadenosine phosphosulfate reductase domain-containing protein n=1 Tax=Rhizobium sp. NPDC090275 TaxID=3364498 RepID=UPI00383A698E
MTIPSLSSPLSVLRTPPIAVTPAIADLLGQEAAVAVGVSGGKDSQAAAIAIFEYLDRIGHAGPRILIHADLGMVEWHDSLPVCERLASALGTQLVVVRRKQGGLMERWESRWHSNVWRYEDLRTVTLVPCWSTPAMRFCTSELKTSKIQGELARSFKGRQIISVVGVRREESRQRARAAVADRNPRNGIWTWRPILDWHEEEVFRSINTRDIEPHPAYRQFGMTRVSCRFCIMSSLADLQAATCQSEAHDLYRRMVDLECRSTFAFQGARWLGDIAPHLLCRDARERLAAAKDKARRRAEVERRILQPMLYVKGWPTRMLSDAEADLLAEVRCQVSELLCLNARYLDRTAIHRRYAALLATRAVKVGAP